MRPTLQLALALLFFLPFLAPDAFAQTSPRFGIATQGLLALPDGFGLGIRGRASAPLNADLSLGIDLGLTGFILGGRRNATYAMEPQISVIVSFPPNDRNLTYWLFGVGGYLPVNVDDNSGGGPTFHGGIGRVMGLRETSVYYEINPAIVIAEERLGLLVPVRVGVIF